MRKQRQGFMKCWNSTHHTVSQKKEEKKITAMLNEKMKNSRMLWKRYRKCSLPEGKKALVVLAAWKSKKIWRRRRERWRGNYFPFNCQALFLAHQIPAITNVKVLSWVIMSQTCCQCPQESLLFKALQFTSKFIAQEKTNICLIQIGMSLYIQ